MMCLHRVAVLLLVLVPALGAPAFAAEGKADVPLAEALEDWVRLLERDDPKAAARWARDAEAARALNLQWGQLKECHEEYNYRTWLDRDPATGGPGARNVGDATRFNVGGHSFGHLHVNWEKGSDGGWRITGVWVCR